MKRLSFKNKNMFFGIASLDHSREGKQNNFMPIRLYSVLDDQI
jgi:hypothetical protein